MKKLLVTMLVLAFAGMAIAQEPAGAGAQPSSAAQAGEQAGQQKPKPPEIKDPAEYNSYVSSVQNPNVQQKISGLEDFLARYPNSVVKKDALEQLMIAYQQTGNAAKTEETAQKLLEIDPNNVRVLALMAYSARTAAGQGQNPQQNIQSAKTYGERGLAALQTMVKPDGVTPAQFEQLKEQTAIIFAGAVGFADFNGKDYANAQKYLQQAVDLRLKVSPSDATNINDIYLLALSYLEPQQINPAGLFWIARAAALSNNNPGILKYGQVKYAKYHGGTDGWNQVLQMAQANPAPPADFAVKPAPTLPEQAANLANTKTAKDMSIAEWELILQYGDQATRDKVWAQIQQIPSIAFQGQVVAADKNTVSLAATEDAITAAKADVVVTMVAAMPLKDIPKVGAQIPIQGKASSYTQSPFVLHLTNGMLIETKKPAPKPAPRRERR